MEQQRLALIRGPVSEPFRAETINACVDAAAAQCPDATAISQFDAQGVLVVQVSFAELRDASGRLAAALAALYAKGTSIGLWGNNSIGWIICQLAILRMGGVVVTLDPGLKSHDLHHMLSSSRAAAVMMDREFRGQDLSELLDNVRSDLPALGDVFFIDEWRTLANGLEPLRDDPCSPEDAALIVFTSGTTGKPKGVILHHQGCVGNAREAMRRTGLSDGSALLNPLPAYSVGGAVCITLGAISTMRPQIVVNHFDPNIVLQLLEKVGFGWMPLVPAMLLPLVNHPRFAETDLSALEAVWMGGTVITPDNVATAREKLGVKVVTIYGQTESSGVHAMNLPDASAEAVSRSVGLPLSHGSIRIASMTDGATLNRGEIGEIRTKSPYATRGYFENAEATEQLFDADDWLCTGDLGMLDDDGLLRITGRLKEMIIRGGRNIYPREIEDVLSDFSNVAEVAVLGVPHDRWGEEVAVALRSLDGSPLDLDAAQRFVADRIAAYKVPAHWRQVEDFPRGSQAKIRKMDLLPLFAEGQ